MSATIAVRPAPPIAKPDQLFIGGEWVAPSTDAKLDVIAPATEELYLSVAEAQEKDVERAVAAARAAFDHGPWPRLSPQGRAGYMRRIAEALRSRVDDIAETWPNEMGVLHSLALAFVATVPDTFDYYADMADRFAWEERHVPGGGGAIGLLVREPVGVVAAIIPWNGPILQIVQKVGPALLAGCTVIIKTSPEAPAAPYIFAEAVEAAGLPKGVISVLTADRAVSEALVRNPGVDKISFTGSTAAGRRVASLCGERIARYTLELGGKSAAVIMDDYDIQAAADTISGGICAMSGQICSALTRVIITRDRHDDLVDALKTNFSKVIVGDPFDPSVTMGPVAMRRQRDRIEALLAQGIAEGAELVTGGGRPNHLNRGFYIEPTIFANVDNSSTLAQEEIFGPVLSVIAADDEDHAIRLANDSIYGLNNSVFSNDPDRAYAAARKLQSGMVGHNAWRTEFSIAFGGFKQSGIGREGGLQGILPYTEAKTIIMNELPTHVRMPA